MSIYSDRAFHAPELLLLGCFMFASLKRFVHMHPFICVFHVFQLVLHNISMDSRFQFIDYLQSGLVYCCSYVSCSTRAILSQRI